MKNKQKILLIFFLTGAAVVFLSLFVNEILFEVVVWTNMDHKIALQSLKIVQLITVPLSGAIFLASLFFAIRKRDLTEKLSKGKRNKIFLVFKTQYLILWFLALICGIHQRYAGDAMDEFITARAHVYLICLNLLFVALSGKNIGFYEILRR